jgi:CHASE1-domain containing sensor protein
MNDRNQRAIGYDISSEKIRQEAIEKVDADKRPNNL